MSPVSWRWKARENGGLEATTHLLPLLLLLQLLRLSLPPHAMQVACFLLRHGLASRAGDGEACSTGRGQQGEGGDVAIRSISVSGQRMSAK